MAHTEMTPRKQETPFGEATLLSRWKHDRYYLMAHGPLDAVRWLFRGASVEVLAAGKSGRHTFAPAPSKVTVERELARIATKWQEAWSARLQDHRLGLDAAPAAVVGGAPAGEITTVGHMLDVIYAERSKRVAASTAQHEVYRTGLWRDQFGDDLPLAALDKPRIATALAAIAKKTSACTANGALGVWRTYLAAAAEAKIVADHRALHVPRIKEIAGARHHRAWWTSEQARVAIAAAETVDRRYRNTAVLLVAVGCYLGLRPEEIVMLRWEDLTLDAVDPKTGDPKPVCHITPHDGWEPKDGEARDIPIHADLLGILNRFRRQSGYLLRAAKGRPGRRRPPKEGAIRRVLRFDPRKTWGLILAAMARRPSPPPPITMYGMRHTFASNYLIAGVSDVKVARWLGHADTRMVHAHYGHLLSYDDDINATARPRPAAGHRVA